MLLRCWKWHLPCPAHQAHDTSLAISIPLSSCFLFTSPEIQSESILRFCGPALSFTLPCHFACVPCFDDCNARVSVLFQHLCRKNLSMKAVALSQRDVWVLPTQLQRLLGEEDVIRYQHTQLQRSLSLTWSLSLTHAWTWIGRQFHTTSAAWIWLRQQ